MIRLERQELAVAVGQTEKAGATMTKEKTTSTISAQCCDCSFFRVTLCELPYRGCRILLAVDEGGFVVLACFGATTLRR
jgi:hypothetical protein